MILGGGGHAHVVVEILREMRDVELVGVLDPDPNLRDVLGVPRLGSDDLIGDLAARGTTGAIATVGDNRVRRALFDRILGSGLRPFNAIHPQAVVSRSASLGRGVVIAPHAVVNAMCRLGDNVIVNTSASIDHHGSIGHHVHVGPGCHLAGSVTVGDSTMLGTGVSVVPGVTIGARVFVSAGVTVARDLSDDARVARDCANKA